MRCEGRQKQFIGLILWRAHCTFHVVADDDLLLLLTLGKKWPSVVL